LQFGFKKDSGCSSAIFILQQVTKYFCSRGSSVYVCAVDASKAFDRINHRLLFEKLRSRNVPVCLSKLLMNWYDKLFSAVRWNSQMSGFFKVSCGVRQGGILSPILFNIYVDDLIKMLKDSDIGCHVGKAYFGCIMYADDLLLLSPSVVGLQEMLDICTVYGLRHDIHFNAKKTVCVAIGKMYRCVHCTLYINNVAIPWANSFKYLGVVFDAGAMLSVNIFSMRYKFYAACNSIISHCHTHEPVKLQLLKSYCMPFLTYCIGATELNKSQVKQLSVCWNDGFRKVFNFHKWESVKIVQWFCGSLPFDYLYDLYKLNFVMNCLSGHQSCIKVLVNIVKFECNTVSQLCTKYSIVNNSGVCRKRALFEHFERLLEL
jgi:hypothetical protein